MPAKTYYADFKAAGVPRKKRRRWLRRWRIPMPDL